MGELDDVGLELNRMVEALAAVVAQIRATSGSLLDASPGDMSELVDPGGAGDRRDRANRHGRRDGRGGAN
ncbi:MAG: hypothetical protein R3C15_23250 [Thermoleophilia bacterium]